DVKQLIEIIIVKLNIDQTRDNPVEKFPWIPYGHALLAVFPSSDDTVISELQNNLAMVLKALGDYAGAKDLLEKAMISNEKNFGPEHPTTAVRYSNLATVLQDLWDYKDALVLSKKSVKIFKKSLPEGHPNIKTVCEIRDGIKKQMGENRVTSGTAGKNKIFFSIRDMTGHGK
ncbi:tetratricopeptide repeat protein, partial [Candidatus Bipolaricaulota bacterium]|nr:tetratricopeptide repeat protein [Candidatus Bipolaricaulota bacterium]